MLHKNAFSKLPWGLAVLAVLGLPLAAPAQTRIIRPTKTFTVSRGAVSSTLAVQPQIQMPPPAVLPDVAAENDYTPPLPRERPNNLHAGRTMTTTRGGMSAYFPGPTDGRYVPPDCGMAVGPDQIVVTINTTIAFYSKTGTKIFQSQMDGANGFFAGVQTTSFVFDPKCFYDPIAGRFFVLADELDQGNGISGVLIAVSDDSNPSGTWYKYRVDTVLSNGGSTYWLDYPGFGFNKDAIVVTGNMFGFSSGYFGVQALVIKKAPLLTGGAVQVSQLLDPGVGTLQPSRTADKNVDRIYGIASGGGNAVRLYAFTSLTGVPALSETDVAVPAYSRPPGPAPSGGNQIDTLDGRMMSANYRAGQLVSSHTIGTTGNGIGVRWYDIDVNSWPQVGSPSLRQSGDLTQTNVALHMPAININSFQDISVCYTRSSGQIGADLCISARYLSDPLGQIGAPVKLGGSQSASYQSFRWGDYFGCEIDPLDDTTFWGFGMTIDANGAYSTQIVNWIVTPPNGAAGTVIPADSVSTFLGSYVVGDQTSVQTEDAISYQIDSTSIAQFGTAAGAEAGFTIPTDTTHIAIQLKTSAGVAGGTNMVWLYNWITGRYDFIGSAPMKASLDTVQTITVPNNRAVLYIGPSGQVKAELRGHFPIKPFNNQMPPPFSYNIDLFQLVVR